MPENPKSLSPNDYIKDIHEAVNAIKKDSIVDSNVIILLGHSEGSNLIPIVAAQRNDIDFIIGLATPARGTDKLLEDKYRLIYKKCDKPEKGEKVVAEIRTSFEKVRNGTWNKDETLSGAYSYYWKVMLDLTDNSVRNYSKLKIPVLLIFGSEDYEVNSKDFELFQTQLKTKNSEVVQLKGVNHFMTTNKSTDVSYEVYKTIIDWLSKFSN
jgi:alpha-beta hydrolase superfamily lysophospholipase